MSSAGQAIGGVVGAIGGFIFGGPTGALYGAQLGMGIGGLIDPPKGPNLQGPRLSDLAQQASTYGAPIPRVYGTVALYGNIIWLQGDSLTEVATTTESGGKGGPTSTQTTYAYYASFAVALCQGPIAGVRRIWVGAELIYDAGSDDMGTILVSNAAAELFTLYLGTDTQEADPLIQADKGVNDTPAYRGIAYLVFDTYPLAKHGNSLLGAQVKVEVVSTGTAAGWTRRVTNTDTTIDFATSAVPGVGKPYIVSINDDVITVGIVDSTTQYRFDADGVFLGASTAASVPILANSGYYYACGKLGGRHVYARLNITAANGVMLCYDASLTAGAAGTGQRLDLELPSDRMIYGVSIANDGSSVLVFLADVGVSGLSAVPMTDALWYELDTGGAVVRNGTVESGPLSYGEINVSRAGGAASYDQNTDRIAHAYGAGTGTVSLYEIGADNVIRELTAAGTLSYYTFTYPSVYLDSNVVFAVSGDHYNAFTFGLLTDATVTLAGIIEAECLRSNLLDAADIDVTALTDEVRGYRIASLGSLRAVLTPLQGVFPFDVVQSGYQITFVPRGGASVDSIPETDLGAGSGGPVPLFTLSREMDSQLPRSVHIKYLDAAREYDIGEQYAERLSTDAVNRLDLEVSVVLTADEAVQVAERLLYLYWLERSDIGPLTLPPEYRHLEPADVVTVAYDDDSYEVRLTGINYRADGCIECTGKLNSATIYTSTAVADTGAVTGTTLSVAGPTVVVLLDIPLMRDDDDTAGFPVAMCGYLDGWPGGVLYRSEDDGQSWVDIVASVSPGAVIGYATTTLSVHGGMMMDKASMLTVRLYSGQLASVTEAQMFNGANWFAYGDDGRWEIIAAQTAALQGDGSYILSDFMRGRNGTEWATGLHAVNDRIVLLSATALKFVSVNSGSIGSERLFRGITFGKALDSDSGAAFTYNGVNLECLSPVYLNGSRHPSTNDWTLTWIRRTRVGGEWRDYVDASLGESSESYEIDIFSDGTYTTLKRTLTATSQTVAYTSAQQVTDFGSNQATLYVRVYQLSATVGRGYALQTSITR